ncbi:MAG: L,D-transpeptidase catalytic domain protein [Hyphomicrobiales bacterium]|nr:L,D-transpeptidase catalytic domain protein [Hyphomicrobiales bacterium]
MRLKTGNKRDCPRGFANLRLVRPTPGSSRSRGYLAAGGLHIPCVIGAGGITRIKREGDGCTPAAVMAVCTGYFRTDRLTRPRAPALLRPLKPADTWCDDPGSFAYNQRRTAPVRHNHERMWLEERVYDIVFVLDFNIRPRVRGRGSAIFFHLTRPDRRPTAGCIAIDIRWMRRLLPLLAKKVVLTAA